MTRVASTDHVAASRHARSLLGAYERERDLILLGAYESGTDDLVDEAVAKVPAIEAFLAQRPDENEPFAASVAAVESFALPLDSIQDETSAETDDWDYEEDGEDFDIE